MLFLAIHLNDAIASFTVSSYESAQCTETQSIPVILYTKASVTPCHQHVKLVATDCTE